MSGIWTAVATAAVGAYSANRSASAARSASRGAGTVDMTTTRNPWDPSTQARTDLMNAAARNASQPIQTFDDWMASRGGSAAPPAPAAARQGGGGGGARAGGGGGGSSPQGNVVYQNGVPGVMSKKGKFQPLGAKAAARAGAGGGAGAAGGAQAEPGVSAQTNQIRNAMIQNAQQGNPLYGQAQGFVSDTLAGEDQNPYRRETFDAMRNVDDPDGARLREYLFNQLENGNGGMGQGGGNRTYYVNSNYAAGPGGGAAGGGGPVGAAGYIKDILDEKFLKEGNPYLEQRVKDALADSQEAFASTVIPGLNSTYNGSGMFGSSMYQNALAQVGEEQARGLAREANAFRSEDFDKRMQEYMQALGYGTEMDLASQELATRGGGGGGGGGDNTAALNLQRQAMILDALGGAIGQGNQMKQFGLAGMSDLAGGMSDDQQFALGSVPAVTGLGLRDWSAAGDLSLGADQNSNQFRLGREGIAAQRAAANKANQLAQQQFQFDIFRDQRGYPMLNVAGAADVVRALSDGYGTTTESGLDRRSQSPYTGSSTAQAISGGIAGAMTGLQLASMYGGNRGGGSGGVTLAPGAANGQGGYYLNFGG